LKNAFLFIFLSSLQLLAPFLAIQTDLASESNMSTVFSEVSSAFRTPPQSIYVRLQTLEEGSVMFWQSIPQSFQDHVATIDVSALAVLVSSNARSIELYKDDVGNLWLAVNYTFNKGDYIGTLTWVSSETLNENLTIPESVLFPESYPDEVKPFLSPGIKIPANDTTIKGIAESYATQNMIETIENILNFLNETQTYDHDKVERLMSGNLNTTDILDFLNDPLTSLQTGDSFCFERALLATAMLRAVGVPTRTFTSADLKTWIQVWLPNIGWVDAEVLCVQPRESLFPRPLSFVVPRMTSNSSDAIFPFSWSPQKLMNVANLTFSGFEAFNINEYGTVLSQPVDDALYNADPDEFSFPIIFEPEIVQAALTRSGSDIIFHVSSEDRSTFKTLKIGETNKIEFEGIGVSFKPILQGDMLILYNFSVYKLWTFDLRILIPLVGAAVAVPVFWLYWKRRKIKP
jgi:hypothetical protein